MVAWTNAPRLTALVMVQPDAAGVVPSGPVSWYGVARPLALSGFAGTMMLQLTLAAVAACAARAQRPRGPPPKRSRTDWPRPPGPTDLYV